MPAPSFSCDDELEAKIQEYLAEQRANDRPISKLGLAVFCGVDKETIYEYGSGRYDDEGLEGFNFSGILRKFAAQCELDLRDGALLGERKERPAMGILAMDYGYTFSPKVGNDGDHAKSVMVAYVGEPEQLESDAIDVEFEEIEFID